MIRALFVVALGFMVGCGDTPTAPSDVPSPLSADPRYDAAFFATFAIFVPQRPKSLTVYVDETDDRGNIVPAETVTRAFQAAASLQESLGLPVDVRHMAGVPLNVVTSALSVRWRWTETDAAVGGFATAISPGAAYVAYRAVTYDVCGGLALTVVRHELMHAMGFGHTDNPQEVMFPDLRYCDVGLSARELFHARLALGTGR